MPLLAALSLAVLLLGGGSAPALAQDEGGAADGDQPFDIRADSIEFETARDMYVAQGDVVIEQPGRSLHADWVAFSNRTRQGIATGNVVVEEGGDRLVADVLHFEVDQLKGIVLDGTLYTDKGGFRLKGSELRKVGDQEYEFEDAEFTTCNCPKDSDRDPWTITAQSADLAIGGYATARNSTVEVLGVPVLWLPWMRYPVKTERQTGFLFPEIGAASRGGVDVGLPFFWAARKNLNVTLTPRWISENGFKPDVEFEYLLGEFSWGNFYATGLADDDDISEDDRFAGLDNERWALEWIHDHQLPEDWRFKVDARLFSDNRYAFDFKDFPGYSQDRFIDSVAFLENRLGKAHRFGFTGQVRWADDQQSPENLDRDDFLVQRLPDLQLSGMPQPLSFLPGGIVGGFDARYTSFGAEKDPDDELGDLRDVDGVFLDTGPDALPDGSELDRAGNLFRADGSVELRRGGTLTAAELAAARPGVSAEELLDASGDSLGGGPEGDGRFQEGELLIDRGHRVVLNPRLSRPFRVADLLEIHPEVGWHGTFYRTDEADLEARNLFTGLVEARTRLRRHLELPFLGRLSHVLEPSATWIGVSDAGQNDNPLFIPRPAVMQERQRQTAPLSIVRDPSDRIEDVNALKLGLGNRFYTAPEEAGKASRLFADSRLSVLHDFTDDDISNVVFDGSFWPAARMRLRSALRWDLEEDELAEAWVRLGYASKRGDDVSLTFRKLEEVPRFFEDFQFEDERFDEFEEGFVEVSQISFSTRIAITRRLGITYQLAHSFEESLLLSNRGGIEYMSRCSCWALRLELEDDRSQGLTFGLRYKVFGITPDTVRPFAGGGDIGSLEELSGGGRSRGLGGASPGLGPADPADF